MKFVLIALLVTALVLIAPVGEAGTGGAAHDKAVYGALDDYEDLQDESVRSVTAPANRGGGTGTEQPRSTGNYTLAAPRKVTSLLMGIENYEYKYRETDENGSGIMNLKGRFKGLFISMVYRPLTMDPYWSEFLDHFVVDARMAWADLNYNGSVQDSNGNIVAPFAMSGVPDVVFELRGVMAKDFAYELFTLTPYAGLGYRYLKDDSSQVTGYYDYLGTTYDLNGYKRESMYVYLPLGMDISRTFPGRWTLGLNGEYDFFLYGQQKTHIETDWGGPLTNDQNTGYGMRGSLRLAKEFTNVGVTFEPFIRYWNIDRSDWGPTENCAVGQLCNGGVEPANTTREVGVKMGMTF